MKRNLIKIAGLIFAAFAVIILYQTYIQIFQGGYYLNHPRNRRLQLLEEVISRGRIIDSGGKVLAETVAVEGRNKRIYPFGERTAHITGYLSGRYGRSGLEASFNQYLLGIDGSFGGEDFWSLQKVDKARQGNDVVLSLDVDLQQLAYKLLGSRRGAVVAVEPSTGRVLAMVSRPGFNPEEVESRWEALTSNPQSPLLNRAAQGLYPPGSIMKIVTTAGILSVKPETVNRIFDAPGYFAIEGRRIEDKQARGRINLTQALALSSNYVFATLGVEQGARVFVEMGRNFGLTTDIPFNLPTVKGRLPNPEQISKLELAESAIGQGRVTVTPLNMCLVAVAVANGGKIMVPTLVDEIRSPQGSQIQSFTPKLMLSPIDAAIAGTLRALMVGAVAAGTGREAAVPGIQVAGKTGSAENPHGQAHAWFIGFAPADNPQVAVAVIVENGGAGGREAAPIAAQIMKTVISGKR